MKDYKKMMHILFNLGLCSELIYCRHLRRYTNGRMAVHHVSIRHLHFLLFSTSFKREFFQSLLLSRLIIGLEFWFWFEFYLPGQTSLFVVILNYDDDDFFKILTFCTITNEKELLLLVTGLSRSNSKEFVKLNRNSEANIILAVAVMLAVVCKISVDVWLGAHVPLRNTHSLTGTVRLADPSFV